MLEIGSSKAHMHLVLCLLGRSLSPGLWATALEPAQTSQYLLVSIARYQLRRVIYIQRRSTAEDSIQLDTSGA